MGAGRGNGDIRNSVHNENKVIKIKKVYHIKDGLFKLMIAIRITICLLFSTWELENYYVLIGISPIY